MYLSDGGIVVVVSDGTVLMVVSLSHKVASSSPVTAMSSFGDWFTQP